MGSSIPVKFSTEFLQTAAAPSFAAACLDVRSEGEFAEGALTGFVNLPILTNTERHEVGFTYKTQGKDEAMRLGHERVSGEVRAERIESWKRVAAALPEKRAFVTCWRGGLRSRLATQWLRKAGCEAIQIQGGYKAIRRELLGPFFETETVPADPRIMILSGFTGSGKTDLLHDLGKKGLPWIDLEGHARHRGSSFGLRLGDIQPTQATFENAMAWDYFRIRQNLPEIGPREMWLEDESRQIGIRALPLSLKNAMQEAAVVMLEVPLETRVKNIFCEYVIRPLEAGFQAEAVRAQMNRSLLGVQKKLGGAMTQEILGDLDRAFQIQEHGNCPPSLEAHADWIGKLLVHYYDKMYRFAFERQSRPVIFQGDEEACRQWMLDRVKQAARVK